jgi:hypothetical protein
LVRQVMGAWKLRCADTLLVLEVEGGGEVVVGAQQHQHDVGDGCRNEHNSQSKLREACSMPVSRTAAMHEDCVSRPCILVGVMCHQTSMEAG